VLRVFRRYVVVMRTLQRTYLLEPAGSHGVWGLDDYCFLPFVFGASQLSTVQGDNARRDVKPSALHDAELRARLAGDNLFMDSVQFVCSVKGPNLPEHSPMLNDISGLSTWGRITAGLIRMYYAEVLGKRPVVQLLVFGNILPWDGRRGKGEH